jgi:hypothetical protein
MSDDAGAIVRLRIVSDSLALPQGTARAEIRGGADSPRARAVDEGALTAERVGIFRLLAAEASPVKMPAPLEQTGTACLVFREVEKWRGSGRVGDQLEAWSPGAVTAASWVPRRDRQPYAFGDLLILELGHGEQSPWNQLWVLGAHARVDSAVGRFYNELGQSLDLADFHRRLDWAAWPLDHPYRARLVGSVLFGDGAPAESVQVEINGVPRSVTDAAGRFRLDDLPIGVRLIRITAPEGVASARIECSDESSDSLEISLPFKRRRIPFH